MPSQLCVDVVFLDGAFHGRGDGGEPEWPPSPLRLFQTLLATAAVRWRDEAFERVAAPAFRFLERLPAPAIRAPSARLSEPYRLSVPNNSMDVVARAWSRGNLSGQGDANPATHRAMKTVQPQRIEADQPLRYLWNLPEPMSDEGLGHVETLLSAARGLAALGWGVDLVAASARVRTDADSADLPGELWRPAPSASNRLRVPCGGAFDSLVRRHQAFLDRVSADGAFQPPAANACFETIGYARATDRPEPPTAEFLVLKPDGSGFQAFDPVRGARALVGMVRHAAAEAARRSGWGDPDAFILGHGETERGAPHAPVGGRRLSFLPIPSIEGRGGGKSSVVGSVRRLVVAGLGEDGASGVEWARRALSGVELVDEKDGRVRALLAYSPRNDVVLKRYRKPSSTWATTTPVVLPGFDDRSGAKTESLLRKAIVQAGFSQELAACALLDWRDVGFLPGVDLASRYHAPSHLRHYPKRHVRITWRDACGNAVDLPGPICLGGGRFVGLGLFTAMDD